MPCLYPPEQHPNHLQAIVGVITSLDFNLVMVHMLSQNIFQVYVNITLKPFLFCIYHNALSQINSLFLGSS